MLPYSRRKLDIFVNFKARVVKKLLVEMLQLLACAQHGSNVRKALERASSELNEALAATPGRITKLDASVDLGISGATVRLVVAVDEGDFRPKSVLWANEGGGSVGAALQRARERINRSLSKLHGEIADFYLKFITTPLKRTYATLIVAVNEDIPRKLGRLSTRERRERLASVLRLLGNDPRAINLAGVAKSFGVSRDTLYHDLESLGLSRQEAPSRR
jgi:hypothetical protein